MDALSSIVAVAAPTVAVYPYTTRLTTAGITNLNE
jgi:hypothetical protein